MFHLIGHLGHFLRSSFLRSSRPAAASHASHLMESADARGGLDPREAQELRSAASAWLRVVR